MEPNDMTLGAGSNSFSYSNFDPSSIQEDEVILAVFFVDVSPSIKAFEKDLNEGFSEFLIEMQNSHVADKLLVKTIKFDEKVHVLTGFMPIKDIQLSNFTFQAQGSGTAIYDAAYLALKEAIDYRTQLESTGINCKVLVFGITDGDDNSSSHRAADIATIIDDLAKEERNFASFETILFGIGKTGAFTAVQKAMHFRHWEQY